MKSPPLQDTPPPQDMPPPARKGRRRKVLAVVLLVLPALPLLAAALGLFALRSAAFRRTVLASVSETIEEGTGIRARAADFSLGVRAGVLVLDDVTLATGDAPAFLTAERVRVEFDWRGLVGDVTVLRALALERPVADLRQPLPPPGDEPMPRIDVHDLRLTDGRLLGAVPAGDGEPWLSEWSAAGVAISGSYVGDHADLRLAPARLQLVRVVEGPLDLEVESRLAGPLEGPWTISDLKLTGEGLRLDGSGELGTAAGDPLFVRLDLEADPALLVTDLGPGGLLRARGELDLRRWRGDLSVTARDFPSQALAPWIGEAARPGGRPSRLDLEARFASDPDAAQQVTGEAELVWRQGETRLAEATANLTDGRLDDDGIVLASLVGDVRARARGLPADFLRPWLGTDRLELAAAAGTRLDLEADFTVDAAAPSAPAGRVDLVWRRGAERLLEASARTLAAGTPPAGTEVEIEFSAALLPATPGRRRAAGRLAAAAWPELAAGELRATRLELELPDVAAAVDDVGRRWPRLFAAAGLEVGSLPPAVVGAVELMAEAAGPLTAPSATLAATWRPDDAASVAVHASGAPLAQSGEARVEIADLDLALFAAELAGRVSGVAHASGAPADWRADLALDVAGLRYGSEMPAFEELRLAAATDGASLELTTLAGRTGDARFSGGGRLELPGPLAELAAGEAKIAAGALQLAADKPFSGVDRLDVAAELADGVVHVTRLELDAVTGPGELFAEVPLGALRAFGVDVDAWPVVVADGRVKVDLGFPSLDLGKLARDFGQEPPWTTNQASLTGRLWLDPADLTAAEGELLVSQWLLEVDRHRLEVADDPILMAIADHRLEILPVTLRGDGHPLDVDAVIELAPGWQLADGFDKLVRAVDGHAGGVVDGGLFTPYLAGGVAQGPVAVEAELSGTLDEAPKNLRGRVVVDGPDAQVVFVTPYLTRLRAPHLELVIDGDEVRIPDVRARLNDGTIEADGRRTADGGWRFAALFQDVRYRFDYGLSALLDGYLELDLPATGRGRLGGEIDVERAVLRRDVDLDREILSLFTAPPDVAGAADDPLEAIDLDLVITTAEGVSIKNNVADLRAGWTAVTVQGTMANPAIEGRIEAEPDGRLFIFGQVARVDQAAVVFTGQPGVPPEIELQPTTSLQDPSLASFRDPALAPKQFEWDSGSASPDDRATQQILGEGLANYYGGQVTERFSDRLGAIRIQPVLIFSETDPATKVIVSRDLSRTVALAVAIDLRDSQEQTYLLDLHDLRGLPRAGFQLFTNEEGHEGVTVQQTLLFGRGRRRARDDRPRLRKVVFGELPEGVSEKALRRAVGFAKNEPLPDGADFDAEVDVAEHLWRRGWPDAVVEARIEPAKKDSADLRIAIETGPHVAFEFTGTTPPVALRRTITALYRTDFYEPASRDEVRAQTVRVLRGQGYLDPRVEVSVEVRDDGSRTVTVSAEGGRQVRLERVVFAGLDDADAALVAGRLASTTGKVELAAAVPQADAWLLSQLRSLGYPEAAVAARRLSDDGRELRVEIAPGPRQRLAALRIEGLGEAAAADYLGRLPLKAGDPPRADRVAAGKYLIQNDLKRQGHAEARVRAVLQPVAEGSAELDLIYEVEAGARYRLDTVHLAGLRATRRKWAEQVTGLEQGSALDARRLGQARRKLLATRLFESVRSTTERFPEGSAAVTFEVEEVPRLQLAYGVRYETEEGASLVLDAVNRNFLGRGITVGLRSLYSADDRAARLYTARSGLFGRRLALEWYLQRRQQDITEPLVPGFPEFGFLEIRSDSWESSLQFSFPLRKLNSRLYARYRRTIEREQPPFFEPFLPFEEEIKFPFVGWQLIYDTRDNLLAPTRGLFASSDLSVTGDYLASDFDFVRLFTQVHWMRPAFKLGGRQLTWAQAWRVGLLESQDQFPLSEELFQAGGEYSVRGYPTDSVVDAPRGGQALLVVNQELRFPIWDMLSGLVFFDFGNAWGDKGDFGSDLFKSTGLGLRADTPFGLIRLDVAFPLDRREEDLFLGREEDPSYKLYLGFGHAF